MPRFRTGKMQQCRLGSAPFTALTCRRQCHSEHHRMHHTSLLITNTGADTDYGNPDVHCSE